MLYKPSIVKKNIWGNIWKKKVNYFIPMRYIEHETLDGKKHRKLTPMLYTICCLSRKNFYGKRTFERVKDCTIPFCLFVTGVHGGVK